MKKKHCTDRERQRLAYT